MKKTEFDDVSYKEVVDHLADSIKSYFYNCCDSDELAGLYDEYSFCRGCPLMTDSCFDGNCGLAVIKFLKEKEILKK